MNSIKANIGGKERTFTFGLKVLGDLVKHFDQDPEQFAVSLAKNPFHTIPVLLYYGAKYDAEMNRQIPDFELIDAYKWAEDEGIQSETIDGITQTLFKTMYECVPTVKELMDMPENEELKKNLIGT